MGKDSFFEKIGRSLKLEDEQYETPNDMGASYQDTENDDEELPDSEDMEELMALGEELGADADSQNNIGTTGETVTTLAMASAEQRSSGTAKSTNDKKNKINTKKTSGAKNRSSSEKSAAKEKNMATKKDVQVEKEVNEKEEEVLEEGRLTIDVYETEEHIVIKSTIAGVEPDDLDINITSDSVAIRGKRHKEEEVSAEDYFYQECYWGAFSRSVILPTEIDPDKAEATMKSGVLTVRLPKLSKTQQKKLQVKIE